MYGLYSGSCFSIESCIKMKNLIIWDFDGVIADTECLWMENRRQLLKKYFNIGWDLETTNHHIGGMNWKTRLETLQKMGYAVDKSFEDEATIMDLAMLELGISLTPGIEEIFAQKNIKQCIATGGTADKTKRKLAAVGISQMFPENKVFLAEMVKRGKPAPDLFLLAAEKMGEKPENCVIIEDSLAGLTAAKKSGAEVIAYVGGKMNNNPEFIRKVKNLGIQNIYDNMADVAAHIFTEMI